MPAKTIQEVINQLNDYMETSTSLGYTSRLKYSKIIRLFLLSKGLSFTVNDINRFITDRNKKSNCYNYKYAFQYFLISIGRKDLYEKIKSVKKKERKKVFKHVPKDILQKIIALLPPKYKYLALIQYKTGCRFIEACTIRNENIDFNLSEDLIYISLGGGLSKTKGGKGRKVRLPKKYEVYLRKFMKKPYGYLFLQPKHETLDEEHLHKSLETLKREYNRELSKAGAYYGYDGFSSHYLRHLFADEFLLHGGTIESLRIVMGHKSIETTAGYISIGEGVADRIIKEMG